MRAEILEINKKTIFKYITQEDIFERYLGFPVELGVHYKNPYRVDNNAGCSFYYRDGSNKLIFNDFAWGVQWDVFDLVMYAFRVNFPEALEKIAYDFGLMDSKRSYTKVAPIKLTQEAKRGNKIKITRKKHFNEQELGYWNVGGLVVTEEDLLANRIFSISHLWEHTHSRVNYYHGLNMTFAFQFGVDVFQIYSPLKKKEERRFINPVSLKVGDLKRLNHKENYVIITKSRKDSFMLRMLGFNSCFIINESVYLTKETQDILSNFPVVFTLFDRDLAGVRASKRFRSLYNTIPLLFYRGVGKDTYAVLKAEGKDYIYEQAAYIKMEYNL